MFDITVVVLGVVFLVLIFAIITLRNAIKTAKSITKFQTYSKSVEESLIDSGIFTEHGMVYDESTNTIKAQHKRSPFFYETVL